MFLATRLRNTGIQSNLVGMRLTKFKTTKHVFDDLLDELHQYAETMCFIIPKDENDFYYIASDTDEVNQNEDVYIALKLKLINFENCSQEEIEKISEDLKAGDLSPFIYRGNADIHLL